MRDHDLNQRSDVMISALSDEPLTARAGLPTRAVRDVRATVLEAVWVRPGEAVSVHDVEITSGWFYFGNAFRSGSTSEAKILVDPLIEIIKPGGARRVKSCMATPYGDMSKTSCRGFLEWMAGNRLVKSDPGFAVQFLYGVEYRLFNDGGYSEFLDILPEIERLCGLFCDSGEFLWRARKLMAYANGLRPEPRRPDYRSCQYSETPPLDVRVVLGRSEFDGPSAAADALLLAVSQPNAYFRTPSLRCPKEFEALWEVRFAQNPKILRLAVTAKRIATNYHSLSGVFIRKLRGPFEKLPDVLHDPKSRAKTAGLVSLFDSCTEELDPYSRYIGRNPGSEGSPQAGLYLPEDLWRVLYAKTPIKLAGLLHGGDLAAGRLGDILAGAEYPLDGAQAKEISFALQRLSLALKSLGVGIEPDGSLADAKPSLDDRAAIFALGVAEGDDGGNWRAAVDAALCCLPTDAPMKARRAVASCVEAPGADANRVAAYAAVAAVPASRQARAIRAASVLPDPARRTAARCAVAGVVAMGCGEPSAVKALEKLYDALGFPRSDLYGALHRGDEDGELAVARDAGPTSAAPAGEPGVRIDEVRLARAMESTSVVSRILADVFGEQHGNPDAPDESASAEASDPGKASKAATFEGLDPPHSALLSSLTGGPMDAVAFGVAARAQGLMPSGALDRINEWGFEQFDDMLVEEGEIFTISVHILPRLASVRNEN